MCISFSELLLVGLVALLVLGPVRLPGAARTAGLWVGRLKRSFNAIKQEVEREIGADEIRRQLHNEHILSMEQEAKKILAPLQSPTTPVTPVETTSAAATAVAGSEPVVEASRISLSKAAAAPTQPAATPHDSTLPPRAP